MSRMNKGVNPSYIGNIIKHNVIYKPFSLCENDYSVRLLYDIYKRKRNITFNDVQYVYKTNYSKTIETIKVLKDLDIIKKIENSKFPFEYCFVRCENGMC